MSYIRLNISDQTQTLNGEVHTSVGDALVAALSSDGSINELALALSGFIAPRDDESPFRGFVEGWNLEPYYAGILIIDLAARIVAARPTYQSECRCEREAL
jgi:hypothetical protein